MSDASSAVHAAIDRWEEGGLLSPELAARLRREVEEEAATGARRLSQYVLAGTAALVLLIAAGLFLDWAWPRMGVEARAGFLAGAGVAVQLLGSRLEWRSRWVPASWFMQAAGLALVLGALGYSERVWPDASLPAWVAAGAALAWAGAAAVRGVRRSAFMPAVHLVFLLAYLATFLERVSELSEDEIVWVLDGVLLAATALLVGLLRRDPDGSEHPWALPAFVAALYAGFFLVWGTAVGPLGWRDAAVYPLDLWVAVMVALTLWGIHRAPPGLQRDWFGRQLAWLVAAWIPLGFFTALEALDGPPELALLMVGGAGVAAFLYADRVGARSVLTAGAGAFVLALWYWGTERAGALGAVVALGVTAGLLFWLSGRWGGPEGTGARAADTPSPD